MISLKSFCLATIVVMASRDSHACTVVGICTVVDMCTVIDTYTVIDTVGGVRSGGSGVSDSLAGSSVNNISEGALKKLNGNYAGLGNNIDKQSAKVLERLRKKEDKLRKKMAGIDSVKAKAVFADAEKKYQQLESRLQAPLSGGVANPLKEYVPGLDSMQTAVRFLQQHGVNLPPGKLQQLQAISTQLEQLQGKLQNANDIQDFIRQREQDLKSQLGQYGLGKDLTGVNSDVYYYQQQLLQYKQVLNDPQKAKDILLSGLGRLPLFQRYMQKYSLLAQLFPAPAETASAQTLAGLQSSAQVQSLISQQTGAFSNANGPNDPGQFLDQQVQAAQSELDKLKGKLSQLGATSGSSNTTIPDFHPDQQKTKSFWKRLEAGWNMQSQGTTNFLPASTELGLSVGYKASDKLSLGVGGSYRLGLGTGWNHIQLSNQGVGLRSYLDVKAKGSIWVSGGFEYNYFQAFSSLRELNSNVQAWQKSALVGLTKKYTIGKKEGKLQLLYDLLAASQIPRGQSLVFRVGYSL